MKFKYRWWGKGDVDASIGQSSSTVFPKILSATGIMLFVFGMPADIVLGKIVPGVGLAIFRREPVVFLRGLVPGQKRTPPGREPPSPFGIGASQLTGWLYLIMGPVYWQTGDAELAFQVGLAASLIGGFIEVLGGFIGRWIVKVVPHKRLDGQHGLPRRWCGSPLVGIAMVFDKPPLRVAALLHGGYRLPGQGGQALSENPHRRGGGGAGGPSLPGAAGTSPGITSPPPSPTWAFTRPPSAAGDIVQGMKGILPLPAGYHPPCRLTISSPPFRAIEAAKAVGDSYPERRSMVMDGCSTMLGSLFGNPFPHHGVLWAPRLEGAGRPGRVLLV